MSDKAVHNAVALSAEMAEKIAAAEERIKEWRARMQRAERFITDWEEFSGEKAPGAAVAVQPVASEDTTRAPKPKNPKKEDVADLTIEILRERGEPMSRDDLFQALADHGMTIHGKNPPVVLQTMLWRMQDHIIHLKGHGYWPRDDAYMAADYEVNESEPDQPEETDHSNEDAESLI